MTQIQQPCRWNDDAWEVLGGIGKHHHKLGCRLLSNYQQPPMPRQQRMSIIETSVWLRIETNDSSIRAHPALHDKWSDNICFGKSNTIKCYVIKHSDQMCPHIWSWLLISIYDLFIIQLFTSNPFSNHHNEIVSLITLSFHSLGATTHLKEFLWGEHVNHFYFIFHFPFVSVH